MSGRHFFLSFYQTGGVFYIYPIFRGATQWGTAVSQTTIVNRWSHFIVIYNGGDKSAASSYEVYINGVKITTGSTNFGAAGGSCNDNAIGSDANDSCVSNMGQFQGQLDDVRVYNYALTATQVKLLSNQGAAVRYGPFLGAP